MPRSLHEAAPRNHVFSSIVNDQQGWSARVDFKGFERLEFVFETHGIVGSIG